MSLPWCRKQLAELFGFFCLWGVFFFFWVFSPALEKLLQDCFISFVADAQDNTFMSSIFSSDSSWPMYHFGIKVLFGM